MTPSEDRFALFGIAVMGNAKTTVKRLSVRNGAKKRN